MIHFFNPGHETAILNASPYYMPPSNVVTMQRDLAFLPAWYASKDDKIYVWDDFDDEYYKYLTNNFRNIPQPLIKSDISLFNNEQISFWGVTKQAINYWLDLNRDNQSSLILPQWDDKYIYLNSRQSAKDCFVNLINRIPQIQTDIIPHFYDSLEEIENIISLSSTQLLAKAPYSSSGRGLLWLPLTGLTRTERQILHGIIKKQRCVAIERVLDKRLDFAMEFMSDGKDRAKFVGYSLFKTNKKGSYESNYLASQEDINSYITDKISNSLLEEVKLNLEDILSKNYASIYNGCIGVDMLIYKQDDINYLHPCLEINMRYNMGYLALMFTKNYLENKSKGDFYIDFSKKENEILNKHNKMLKQYPAIFENNRLKRGYLPLCPVKSSSHYWAYVLVQ